MPVGAGKKALLASLGLIASTGTAAALASFWKKDDVVAQCAQPPDLPASSNFIHLYPGPPPGIPCDAGPGPSACGRWEQNWDRREPASLIRPPKKNAESSTGIIKENELAAATPKATRNLFFIRHGHYMVDGISDEGRMLTELGQAQAANTGKRLADLNFPWTKVVHSSMLRARETAQIIASELPGILVETTDLLREGAPIPPEPPVSNWRPGAQQFFEDGARIEAAFRKFIHRADPDQEKDSYEIIVCHANVIRYFVCRALQLPPEAWLRMSLHHASITWVTIRPNGRVSLRTFGDSGHIPPHQLTTS